MPRKKYKVRNWKEKNAEWAAIAQQKIIKVFDLIKILHAHPMTKQEIANKFKITERTVYRYLHLLEAIGVKVEKDESDNFYILRENCPLCKAKYL